LIGKEGPLASVMGKRSPKGFFWIENQAFLLCYPRGIAMKIIHSFLLLIFFVTPTFLCAETLTIKYAIFPAPPYMIESGEHQISGIDVDIVKEIALRMNLKIVFISGSWARCLELMKYGDADLLSSAFKKPDREVFMAYFNSPYLDHLTIAFYSKKGKGYKINTYEDLYGFGTIGVLRGASYFDRFDSDGKLNKYKISKQEQLLPMLLNDRLDIIAEYVPTFNYWISTKGYSEKIEKSKFQFNQISEVYMAISRKSPLAARIDEFNLVNETLLKEGFIGKKIKEYTSR